MTEQTEQLTIDVRGYEHTDAGFVYKTWLRSYRPYKSRVPDDIYYPSHEETIRAIIQRPDARCVVACDAAKPEYIYGFCAAEAFQTADIREPLVVHYIQTKLSYRKMGIARYMMSSLGWYRGRTVHATHWTKFCRDTHAKYSLIDNDYFLRGYQHGRFHTYDPTHHVQPDADFPLERTNQRQDATGTP